MDSKIINILAEIFYINWKEEKKLQGYHVPALCPNYEKNEDDEEVKMNDDLIHCNKCLSNLDGYEKLSGFQKSKYEEIAKKFYSLLNEKNLDVILKK
jgi:hypothetical protein